MLNSAGGHTVLFKQLALDWDVGFHLCLVSGLCSFNKTPKGTIVGVQLLSERGKTSAKIRATLKVSRSGERK